MTITIPDHPDLEQKAAEAGFATARDYVVHLIEEAAGPFSGVRSGSGEAEAEGAAAAAAFSIDRFEQGMARIRELAVATGVPVDDSRESIYPDPDEL